MGLVLNNFASGGKTHPRKVQLSLSSGTELHDSGQVGAAYALGVPNVNSHFTLRVYIGMAFRNANYDTKVQTIIHELSQRVLQTVDEQNNACSGVDGMKYSVAISSRHTVQGGRPHNAVPSKPDLRRISSENAKIEQSKLWFRLTLTCSLEGGSPGSWK